MSKRNLWILLTLLAVLLVAGMIFFFSAQQAEDSSKMSGGFTRWLLTRLRPDYFELPAKEQRAILRTYERIVRKLAHFSEYALLGFCLTAFLRTIRHTRPFLRLGAMAWVAGTLYAGTDELHQMFVDGRGPALLDVGIDSGGVLCGALLAIALLTLRQRRKRALKMNA